MLAQRTRSWNVAWNWWLRRNPTYLLSAAAMAVGAKLYLDAPNARAGDIGLILLTLGVLQLYELAVSTVLVVLHHLRRSPEDQPSLLLVAALFWTGPLAATLELSEHDAWLGLGFAIAACILAVVELQSLQRWLELRISPAGSLVAGLCLLLITLAPWRLRVPYTAAGTDEIGLYGCWWLLAAMALFALPAVRWHAWHARPNGVTGEAARALKRELAFLALVAAATGTHLYAMNYTFCGHARAFYGAPLILAATLVGWEMLAALRTRDRRVHAVFAAFPIIAIMLSWPGFDGEVPAGQLPPLLRDPRLAILACAALAWWYGAARHKLALLLHAGSAAAALAVLLALPRPMPAIEIVRPAAPWPLAIVCALYGVAAYFLLSGLWRRSQVELGAALLAGMVATSAWVWRRTDADVLAILLVAGWGWLLATHIGAAGRNWGPRVAPLLLLVAASCGFDFDTRLCWLARGHALAMTLLLLAAGWCWPQTRYARLGSAAGGVWLTFCLARGVTQGPNAAARLTVVSAFALLAAGVAISWYKHRLLVPVRARPSSPEDVNPPAPPTA